MDRESSLELAMDGPRGWRRMAPADDLTYSFATPDDRDEVLHFYEHEFVTREPMRMGMGLTWDYEREWVASEIDKLCSCQASVVARDPEKDSKVVGIRLCKFIGRDSRKSFQKHMEETTGKMRIFTEVMYRLQKGFDLFEDEAVKKVLEYVTLCVAEDYSGRGVSYRMCEMSEKLGKALGAKYVRVEATNIKSQRIFRKMGFQVRGSIDFATYEVDGENVFDLTLMGNSTCAQSMIKKL